MRKLFVVSILLGCVCLCIELFIEVASWTDELQKTILARHVDVRSLERITHPLFLGGSMLICGGIIGLFLLRSASGNYLKQRKAIGTAAAYILATFWLAQAAFVLAFPQAAYERFKDNNLLYTAGMFSFAGLITLPVLLCLWRARKHYKITESVDVLCSECGYNLIENASGICPECGTMIPDKVRDYLVPFPVGEFRVSQVSSE